MNAVAAWGAFSVVLLAGWSLGVFSLRAAGVRLPTGKVGFCFGMLVSAAVGLLFLSYFVFLSFRLGIYLGQGTAWTACGLAVLLGILGWKFFLKESSQEPLSLTPRTPLQGFALAGIVAACLCILIACVLIPLKSYDARMIWAFHAKLIYASGTHPAPELLREGFVIGHPQYPPLFPLAMALVAAIRGELYEPAMRMVAVLFYFAVLALLLFELPRRENRWGFLLVAMYALTPTLTVYEEGGADAGVADVPLSFALLAAWVFLGQCEEAEEKYLFPLSVLSGFLLALAGLVKNEGLVLGGLSCGALWLFPPKGNRRLALAATVAWIVPLIPWLFLRGQIPDLFEERYGANLTLTRLWWGLERAPEILWTMTRAMLFVPHRAGFFWWVILLWWLSSGRKKEIFGSGRLWLVFVYFGIVFVLYLVSPWEEDYQVRLSFSRILLQVAPLALLCVTAREGAAKEAPALATS